MGLTSEGGWFSPVEGPSEIDPELVGEHLMTTLRWRLGTDRIEVAEFERRVGFLIAAEGWGWEAALPPTRPRPDDLERVRTEGSVVHELQATPEGTSCGSACS